MTKPTPKGLIPFKKNDKRTIELAIKGGKVKSERKSIAVRLNGLANSKKFNKEQLYINQLMREKRYTDLANEFITMNSIEGYKDPERRDKVISQLQVYLPKININHNIDEPQRLQIIFNILKIRGLNDVIEDIGKALAIQGEEITDV